MFASKKSFYRVIEIFFRSMIICLFLYSMPVLSQSQDTKAEAIENENILHAENTVLKISIEDSSNELIFRPGDALELKVYPDTASFPNGIYTIDGKGYAYLPLLGYKKITDKTVGNLKSLLKDAYVNYLPQPNIQVRPLIRVSLQGGFFHPGLYWVDARESMWNIVQRAGGTMREDGLEKLKWRRDRMTISRDLIPFIESGKSLYSIGFKSGDQVVVTLRPKKLFWDVFRTDVLPIMSISLSAIAAIATALLAYERY
jgi:protein involved in polysaccharide export with SLBB domain